VIFILTKPKLAKCDNRNLLAKKHPFSGSPEDWFNNKIINVSGVFGISFDFFVDWQKNKIAEEIWNKLIVDGSEARWLSYDKSFLYEEIKKVGGSCMINKLVDFSFRYNFKLKYFLFKEQNSWCDSDRILKIEMGFDVENTIAKIITIKELQYNIQKLSGGEVRLGSKGLIYGTSTLECYLSKTNSLWPGDVDLLLLDSDGKCLALLEFKKHTLNSGIGTQRLSNYYPTPDGRKYNRLALLRDYLGKDVPIIIVYYPTTHTLNEYKIEVISGEMGRLATEKTDVAKLPKNIDEYSSILNNVML
jgi:hypothetical protein